MKYAPRPALARFFGFLMGNAFGEALMGVCADAVVPVPLHGRRLRQRGFNQAVLMAEGLHRSLNVRILRDGLLRWRWTDPQVSLSRPRREANMRGAFRVPRPSAVEGRRLILLDDVYTTGSTLREAARALKEAGARQVHVVALARVL
jgi:ComF family protein